MQATELARERDNLNGQIVNLRTELAEAKAEAGLDSAGTEGRFREPTLQDA